MQVNDENLTEKFFQAGAVQCGNFTLKSGLTSPIYLDLRNAICNPELLAQMTQRLAGLIKGVDYDLLCGVPYSAIPLATACALLLKKPFVLRRKDSKSYGLKKNIDGPFITGQKVLVIEDIITTGESVLMTIEDLESAGLIVTDVAVVVDRDQGGREILAKKGIRLVSLFTLSGIVETLSQKSLIERDKLKEIRDYLVARK
jgi:uridine monophosphate synthetase